MRTLSSSLLALLLVTACDSGKKAEPNADEAKRAQEEDDEAKRIEARRLEREAKAAAEVKAAEDKKKIIADLCVVPDDVKKPKKLDAACDELVQAQTDFFARQYADEPETLAKLEKTAAMQKANTLKMCTSIDIAVGLKHALDTAPMGMAKDLNDIISTCIMKVSEPPKGAAVVPPKPG